MLGAPITSDVAHLATSRFTKEETKTIHDDENEEVEEKKKVDGVFAGIIKCAMVKSRYIWDGHPTFNRNPYNGYLNPYYWVDDHPLLYMEVMGV